MQQGWLCPDLWFFFLLVIRIQPCLHNLSYAVCSLVDKIGKENVSAREVDLQGNKRHLAEIGNFPERVITDSYNIPLPNAAFLEAISKFGNFLGGLEILFSDSDNRRGRYLEDAFKIKGDAEQKINIAIALGRQIFVKYFVPNFNNA